MLPAFHTPVVFSDKEFEVTRLIIRGLHLNYKVKAMAHLHGLVVMLLKLLWLQKH